MKSLAYYYGNKMQKFCNNSWQSTRSFVCRCFDKILVIVACYYRYLLLLITTILINPFFTHLIYFISLSFLGFGFLKCSKPRPGFEPENLDLFYTAVSAITTSSMSTVEMEVFSNTQLIVLTVLMFIGGEIFTSMLGLHLKINIRRRTWPKCCSDDDQAKLMLHDHIQSVLKFLSFLVLGYFLTLQIIGISSVLIYMSLVSTARDVLKSKGINTFTFVVFTVVSTFAGCGFVPTNENMMVFRKNSGLLMILIPQTLMGNMLFPPCLRFSIWVFGKISKSKRDECEYLLKNTASELGFKHLLPRVHSLSLVATVFGFILIGFVLFCGLEWDSEILSGMSSYEKVIGVFFQNVNARHTGESIVDLSAIAPALLVFFVVMMYLPPYTSFVPRIEEEEEEEERVEAGMRKIRRSRYNFVNNLIFSQLSYLVIFIILICITERKNLKQDPINFSVLNIIVEVISAYGNVGFTTGYSCERQVRPDPNCMDKWYGLSGKWSDEGKILLIIVMFFGRLKRFNMNGGQAWKLL